MFVKIFTLYIYFQSLLCGCASDRWRSDFVRLRKDFKVSIERIARLDPRISESSGLAHASDSTLWTHSDGGSLNELYLTNLQGELLQTVPLQVPNHDWEDLAQDEQGNLYIGDFGNNANNRQNLQIHQVQPENMTVSQTMRFRFGDQTDYNPPLLRRHHDMEAFLYHNDSLYLFTKSWAMRPTSKLYTLPASSGTYTLYPREELRLKSAVTAADISPAAQEFALLGYGRLYLFQPPEGGPAVTFNGTRYCLPVGRTGQAEGILYLSQNQLLISNENGKLFLVTLQPKSKKN